MTSMICPVACRKAQNFQQELERKCMGLSVSYVEKELQAVRFRAHMEAIQVGRGEKAGGLRVLDDAAQKACTYGRRNGALPVIRVGGLQGSLQVHGETCLRSLLYCDGRPIGANGCQKGI